MNSLNCDYNLFEFHLEYIDLEIVFLFNFAMKLGFPLDEYNIYRSMWYVVNSILSQIVIALRD